MKAIILAAGRGSRMGELTVDSPKCLMELKGRKLLEWQLSALREAGIQQIGIVTGYRNDLIAPYELMEFHNSHWQKTNMVSSLACAELWLNEFPCIISYSDIFYKSSAVHELINCDSALGITYDPQWRKLWEKRFGNPLIDAETFRKSDDGYLVEIGNAPGSVEDIQGQYMGLLRFTPPGWAEAKRILQNIDAGQRATIQMTSLLQRIVGAGRVRVRAIPYVGEWGEIDSPLDLLMYNDKPDLMA
jgi:choline kinase